MKTSSKPVLALILFFVCLSIGYSQQPPPAMSVEKLADNIYMVKGGSGANTGFFVGQKGVLAIDAKMTTDAATQMIEEIKKVTPKPIITMVITHSDGDHVNGLAGFPLGMKIIAHPQTKKDMEEAFKSPGLEALRAYLPDTTFSDKMDLKMGRELIQMLFVCPAHTSGDIVVFFPEEKIAFVGDLVFIGRDPLIHRQKGGTSLGLVKYLKVLLELKADRYVPGHGDVVLKSDIATLMKNIEEKQARIKALIQEGKSLDEVKKSFGIEERPAAPGACRFMSLVEVIYLDLKEVK
jgi:glyoxylase-like metal-dependent hydrolase (beta-lactamase superfamily II)